MSTTEQYSREETARHGKEIYQRVVLPHMKPEDKGTIVAIDIRSEAWAQAESAIAATRKLGSDRPDAVWIVRVGYAAYHNLGGHRLKRRIQ